MKPNDVLSKELHVKPLEEGETATFRLCNANKLGNKYSEEGRRIPINPQVYQLDPVDQLYDPIKKTTVVIANVVAEKTIEKDGELKKQPVMEPIFIENGQLVLNHRQNDTFAFMMRSNLNASNQFRDHSKKARFELVDAVKEFNDEIAYEEVEDDAIVLLRESTPEDVLKIAANLSEPYRSRVDDNKSVKEIRHALRGIIRQGNPEAVIKASDYKLGKVKLQVIEAEKWLILRRSDQLKAWYFKAVNEDEVELMRVKVEDDMLDGLVDWIMKTKEGLKYYQTGFKESMRFFRTE